MTVNQLLIGTVVVLTLATSAEGASVLWSVTGDPNVPPDQARTSLRRAIWTPIAAFETEEACTAAKTESRNREGSTMSQEDRAVWMIFHCLPDTIDPRGPKGKP